MTTPLLAQELSSTSRLGLPAILRSTDGDSDPIKIALGRRLFFDARLSGDGSISCSSCHVPEKAFTDGRALAQGIRGQRGTRNTPTILNAAFFESQFWDGRRKTLEEQAADPFTNALEHGLTDHATLLRTIKSDERYVREFQLAFSANRSAISLAHVTQAIAAFERTLIAGDSPFDRYFYAAEKDALSDSAKRGLELFQGRAACASCHIIGERHATLTDNRFHSLGVGYKQIESTLAATVTSTARLSDAALIQRIGTDAHIAELGRFVVTRRPEDIGKFKTPGLRNVALTAPYMHDGSVATLEEAVELEVYYRSLEANRPLILTPREKLDLVEFLKSLTSPEAKTLLQH